jgi:PIN domain nuclease of toxin-antitoxin system
MKSSLLLDTHVALWWFAGDKRLDAKVCELIRSCNCHVSLASVWEIAIKYRLGKLPVAPQDFLGAIESASMHLLPIRTTHLIETAELPLLHRDPFDRLLVAQCQTEKLTLVTGDAQIAAYPVPVRLIA